MRLGMIVRADKTGLANQTRDICEMLKPDKVLVINSKPFNGNEQVKGIYNKYNAFVVDGFPSPQQCDWFLRGLDAILTCETFYGSSFILHAKNKGIKTINQYNYEFLDYLLPNNKLPMVDKLLSPSYWKLDEISERFGNVEYVPPPTNDERFKEVREINLSENKKRFLHIVGKAAVNDRNGTNDLLESLPYTESDFELTIKSQYPIKVTGDPRIKLEIGSPDDERELYKGYDALIMPRRYGGLCLPMNEGLLSGLPVIMTDISPNNKVLPYDWLVPSEPRGEFFTRTMIDLYSANHPALANKIDWLCETNLSVEKRKAVEIGMQNYSFQALYDRWIEAINL